MLMMDFVRYVWFGFYRVDLELSDETTFDMIGPAFPFKNLVENRLFCI